ncbi:Placenta-expressed transcript 1 protein [Tupaia chinensis]|uniref:Placenta-expressed transcript 1 protein n=1 Tax=Tupaia chinensis TaxID=246437 RepID=L9KMR7_TUPCH|nr:Placenta-expressed transcript 1 protein [Tupaia chinensis]
MYDLIHKLHINRRWSPPNHRDPCMIFDEVSTTTSPGIKVNSDVFENNTVYLVRIPVTSNVSSVVLRALDKNNNSVGFWQGADMTCNSSFLYHVQYLHNTFFEANWKAFNVKNITEVELQAFNVYLNKTATFSSVKLKNARMVTTTASMTSTTTIPKTSATSTPKTSATSTPKTSNTSPTKTPTLSTTRSMANRVFSSPITDAIHILIAFLTCKLLF